MYLLDTDHFTLAINGNAEVTRHLLEIPSEQIWLSSVVVEEIMTGHIALLNKARSRRIRASVEEAHRQMVLSIYDLNRFQILVYDEAAEEIFQKYPPAVKRVGPQDCRIAAQALAHKMTVVTRNRRDFEATGATLADWSETRV